MNSRISFNSGGKKYFKYLVVVIVVFAVVLIVRNVLASSNGSSNQTGDRVQLKDATFSQELNKDFSIELTDENGDETEPVSMKLVNTELRDEIIVQGQKATSVAGRSFLVVNLKIVNPLEQGVEINTKDYLRLVEGDSSEWLAPDIHNDPVLIQAISSKPTRLGFPVNSNTRKFRLQIGEISGEKEIVEINF